MIQFALLLLVLAGLAVLLIGAARIVERRVRSGSPVHRELKDEWFGDDAANLEDD